MGSGLAPMGLDPRNLRAQQFDPLAEFVLRIGGEVFPREEARRVAFRPGTVFVHGGNHRALPRLLSMPRPASPRREATRCRNRATGAPILADKLPATMIAMGYDAPGAADVFRPETMDVPQPGPGQVLIRVAFAGVNRPDVIQRQGFYPPPPGASPICGLEVSGRIVAIGQGVEPELLNQAVCALTPGGGYAEYCLTDARHCLPIPAGLSPAEAGALPETMFTVWHNVFQRGLACEGETLLVHGGTSGIGTTAIQLAKAFDMRVVATAGSDEKCAVVRELGADLAVNYKTQDFVEEVKAFTGGAGVNVVLDMVSGDYVARNIECLADDGRHVTIAVLGGLKAEINMATVMRKRLTLTGSTLRPRSDDFKALLADEIAEVAWPLVADGTVRPVMHSTFPLADVGKAHALMESGDLVGKIVLEVAGG